MQLMCRIFGAAIYAGLWLGLGDSWVDTESLICFA
jgi:hypothetical protein